MLKQRNRIKVKTPRRQISRARNNRSLMNRQRAFFIQTHFSGSLEEQSHSEA